MITLQTRRRGTQITKTWLCQPQTVAQTKRLLLAAGWAIVSQQGV